MNKTYNNGKDLMPEDVLTYTDKEGHAHAFLGFVPFEMVGEGTAVPNTKKMKLYHCGGDTEEDARRDLLQHLQDTLEEIEVTKA